MSAVRPLAKLPGAIVCLVIAGVVAWPSSAQAALVSGGSFKDGFHAQTGIGGEVGNYFTGYNRTGNPAWLHDPVESMDGDSQKIWSDGIAFSSGIYQVLTGKTVGISYQLSAWAATTYTGASRDTYDTGQRIGIDPYGGTDRDSPNIVWTQTFWQNNIWHRNIVKAIARSTSVTVFVEVIASQGRAAQQTWIDIVEQEALPTVRITAGPSAAPADTTVTITWDTDITSTSQVRYGINSTTEQSSPLDGNLVTHHQVTLTDLTPGATYKYQVVSTKAGYEDGVSETMTFQTPSIVTTTSPAGTVVAGWNLISVPRSPQDPAPAIVFAGIPIDGRLHRWDAAARAYVTYSQADPSAFGSVERGVGYWLYADGPQTISYSGAVSSADAEVALHAAGWHLIGHPQAAAKALSSCSLRNNGTGATHTYADAATLGWISDPMYWHEQASGSYRGSGLDPWDADHSLQPWRGYWTHTAAGLDLDLIVPG
jgi:hypothetical protein